MIDQGYATRSDYVLQMLNELKNYAAPWVGLLFRGQSVKLFRHLSQVLLSNPVFRHFIFNRLPNFVRKEGGSYSKVTFGL